MSRLSLIFAAVTGALGVGMGAFGAHALKEHLLGLGYFEVFQTAVGYQFYHTLLLLFIGYLQSQSPSLKFRLAAIFTMTGILLFSGSLYILSLSGQSFWGAITPVGGLLLILGWSFLALGFLESGKSLFKDPPA